ncbi:unnamed protein product [Callosobruchus maculatus]|uniref:Transposable element P transposase-like RNase H domain-containing protein n=1 Tax=Callosobruchus maculatus TaxID=64391 RepID=A0A653C5W9_CALMS|nr:unnamed protein product [Callosobruchus maculatus]
MITSSFHVSPDDSFKNGYFSHLASLLNGREKIVCLLIDEIYVKAGLQYKSNNITGYASNNSNQLAKTVMAFMISSAFGHFKEVIGLVPVYNITGIDLKQYVLDAVNSVQNYGFKVLCIIADNSRLNQNAFNQLSHQFYIENPKFVNEKIFILFDFVHIFKNIRNNWLNQKEVEKAFIFPDFNDYSIELKASFLDLRDLYKLEINKTTKRAFKLNEKSLYPNNLERQNVTLVDNIFHESTIAALQSCSIFGGTASFLQIIRNWWSVVNVKSNFKGQIKRNVLATPILSVSEDKLNFLKKFVEWLDAWHQSPTSKGLTQDTYNALKRSTLVLIEIIKYSFPKFDIDYILPGKFQTDNLEKRFSRYRNLSGCNYNVSVKQIYESEKKIRIQNLIKVGNMNDFKSINFDEQDHMDIENNVIDFSFVLRTNYLETYSLDKSVQTYICGYAAHSIQNNKNIACEECKQIVIKSKGESVEDDYFDYMQRGGLCIATDQIEFIYYHLCAIFEYIVNEPETLSKFLKKQNHKYLLASLALESLENDRFFIDFSVCPECGTSARKIYLIVALIFSNIVLHNFCKNKNNDVSTSKKRKMLTLQN